MFIDSELQSNFKAALQVALTARSVATRQKPAELVCHATGTHACRYALEYLGIAGLVKRVIFVELRGPSPGDCRLPEEWGGDACPRRLSPGAHLG